MIMNTKYKLLGAFILGVLFLFTSASVQADHYYDNKMRKVQRLAHQLENELAYLVKRARRHYRSYHHRHSRRELRAFYRLYNEADDFHYEVERRRSTLRRTKSDFYRLKRYYRYASRYISGYDYHVRSSWQDIRRIIHRLERLYESTRYRDDHRRWHRRDRYYRDRWDYYYRD